MATHKTHTTRALEALAKERATKEYIFTYAEACLIRNALIEYKHTIPKLSAFYQQTCALVEQFKDDVSAWKE